MQSDVLTTMTFSQRMGITAVKAPFQIDYLDRDLRTRLWNALFEHLFFKLDNWAYKKRDQLIVSIWTDFFIDTVDKLDRDEYNRIDPGSFEEDMKDWLYEAEYFRVFDFIEFIVPLIEQAEAKATEPFINDCNKALEKEGSVYRIINRMVVRTIGAAELKAIEQAAEDAPADEPLRSYFSRALELLADRKDPDYNQVILEAIKAVDWALLKYPSYNITHNALSPITVYTNTLISVRQLLSEPGTAATFEEAKFWLLICATLIKSLKERVG